MPFLVAAAVSAATLSAPLPARAQEAPARPQLVVLVTVDQLSSEYFQRWGHEFTGGFARFWNQGAAFVNAVHDHGITETAAGHATLGAGRHPRNTGIMRNETGVPDPQSPLLEGGRGGGASPYRYRGTSLFDWMRARDGGSRALSVSRKDRGAILPLGRARQSAFWYSSDGRFLTSRYYADTLPAWVHAFNRRDFVGALEGQVWNLLLPEARYPEPDSVSAENAGRDFLFPHPLPADKARRASQLAEFPVMDSITAAFALAGIDAMQLGAGTSTDFLGLSLSTTDAVGHRYGPGSRELHDQVMRADRYLGQFMDSLFRMRDSTRILFALSADHGITPYPELFFTGADSGRGRADPRPVFARARSELLAAYGLEGDAIQFFSGVVVLDTARLHAKRVPVDSMITALRSALRAIPGVMRVDAEPELDALAARGDMYARRWRNSIPADMGAALTVTLEPNHYWRSTTSATHGQPHDSDARVPLIFLGPAFTTGRYTAPARTVDLAATMAAALGIAPLEPIDGVPLYEALHGDPRSSTSNVAPRGTSAAGTSNDTPRRP